MLELLNTLTGGFGPLIAIVAAVLAAIGFVAKTRYTAKKAGKAEAVKEAETHVEQSRTQAEQVRQSSERLSGDDARDELRNKWSRP